MEQVRGLVPVTEGGAGEVGVAEVEEEAGEGEGPAPAILAAEGALWNAPDWPCGLAGGAAPPGAVRRSSWQHQGRSGKRTAR